MASYTVGLGIFGALAKLNFKWPPKAVHAEAIAHHSTIFMHNKHFTMYASTYNILTL